MSEGGTHTTLAVPFRVLTCVRCRTPVAVLELPGVHLDPQTYVCQDCWRVKT